MIRFTDLRGASMESQRTGSFEAFKHSGPAQKLGRRGPRSGQRISGMSVHVSQIELLLCGAARCLTPLVRPLFHSASVSVMRRGSCFPSAFLLTQTSTWRIQRGGAHEFSLNIASLLGDAEVDGLVAEKLDTALQKLQSQVSVQWSISLVYHSSLKHEAGKNQNLTMEMKMRTNMNKNTNTNTNMHTNTSTNTNTNTNTNTSMHMHMTCTWTCTWT